MIGDEKLCMAKLKHKWLDLPGERTQYVIHELQKEIKRFFTYADLLIFPFNYLY